MSTDTKSVEVIITFNSGEQATILVPVAKNKYASLQSKASTYRSALMYKLIEPNPAKRLTKAGVIQKWTSSVVDAWHAIVDEAAKSQFPDGVKEMISSIAPASSFLELTFPEEEDVLDEVADEDEDEDIELVDEEELEDEEI